MRIEVAGIPAPQGSKRHVGGGRMIEMSKGVSAWREAVRHETALAVALETQGTPDGPVRVEIMFYLPRPKSTPKKVLYPAKRPDVDKLARAVLDGLVAGWAMRDDAQVVTLVAMKRFADDRDRVPGCVIEIEEEWT
jgi:crossover junction endodeoxyribonuclease RusA